ncbi:MAG: response regulator [Desulfobacteraceae bacterium]|nr:MAG: response regulator [Desulfobacteraceae bacterium]
MKTESTSPEDSSSNPEKELRRRAEERFQASEEAIQASFSSEETKRLFNELRVYQIELDMQNEELRRTQAELEASRIRYFNLYDLAPVGYCTITGNGLILEANLTAAALLNLTRTDLLNRPITNFILPEDQDIYYRHRNLLFETGAPQVCELRMRRTNADPFWARVEATIQDIDGTALCQAAISDITDHILSEVEKTKIDAQSQQIRKTESLGRMAGAVAHHFNNLLTVVIGNLELALENQTHHTAGSLTDALKAAEKAAELSGLMLTYLGKSSCKHETLDLSEACRRILPMLQALFPKDIALKIDLPSPGPIIRVNTSQIQQILTNLITNAWEAIGDNHGTIELTVKTIESLTTGITYHYPIDWRPRDIPYACLEVSDTGFGIPRKDFENLFDPFFSSKFTGRGMGLAVILGITRMHHGVISVESIPEQGSTFRVYFPITDKETRQQTEARVTPAMEGFGQVLVVDDDGDVRNLTETMLAHLGFTVLQAKDGMEALKVFRHHKENIRFVVCDLTMPQMDGWETLAGLRRIDPGIRVILASGYSEGEAMKGEHADRPQAFLKKPFTLNSLIAKVKEVLDAD